MKRASLINVAIEFLTLSINRGSLDGFPNSTLVVSDESSNVVLNITFRLREL